MGSDCVEEQQKERKKPEDQTDLNKDIRGKRKPFERMKLAA